MLLEVFSGWFVATPHQRPAIVWSHRQDIKQQLRDAAARIIQLVWRKHILSRLKPTPYKIPRQECSFLRVSSMGTRYVNAVKDFRRLMRQKVSLHINFVESQNRDFDEPAAPNNQNLYSDEDESYAPENGPGEVEERLRAMEALILALTSKIDTLVAKPPDSLPVVI